MKKIQYQVFNLKNYTAVYEFWKSMPEIVLSAADSQEDMELFLERNPDLSFMALSEGKVVGTLLCGHDGRRGFLYHLAVLAEFRNQGIAKQLVKMALNKLKLLKIERVHLFILETNHSGKDFWEKMGFEKRKDIEIMSLKLNSE